MRQSELAENESIEIDLLLEAIWRKYGFDFREYGRASIRRRILKHMQECKLDSISLMQHELLTNSMFFNELATAITVNVTEMFRDPKCFKAIKATVIPELKKREHLRIWSAGCSSGEEIYSVAILLHESGILDRCQIYATDTDAVSIAKARNAIYPAESMQKFTQNYNTAGGEKSFSDYYTAKYENAILKKWLSGKVLFSLHNLAVDSVFSEMDLILCRNVLIYFNRELQNKVLKLFSDSLDTGGFLVLGSKESIQFSDVADNFDVVDGIEKIYRKKAEQ